MRTLPPQHLRRAYYADVERQLLDLFDEVIYRPVADLLAEAPTNRARGVLSVGNAARDALREALAEGRVHYAAGVFSGDFNADIGRALREIGAEFDRGERVYRLAPEWVPQWVHLEAAAHEMRSRDLQQAILRRLDKVEREMDIIVAGEPVSADGLVARVDAGWRESAASITVAPELGPEARRRLARAYSEQLRKPVMDFTREQVLGLRAAVARSAMRGVRAEETAQALKQLRGVGSRKAHFLARQETGLFMSAFRRARFEELGVRRYKWATAGDARVRPAVGLTGKARAHSGNHRQLNGRVFRYDQPPVVDPHTGRRGNPGEDFNCRCVDLPVVEEVGTP